MKKMVLVATMALSLGAGMAQAGPLTPGSTGLDNQVLGAVAGYYGAALYLVGAGSEGAQVKVDFVGKEAGDNNRFFYDDLGTANDVYYENSYASGNQASPDATLTVASASCPLGLCSKTVTMYNGLLNFSFSGPAGSVANGPGNTPGGFSFFTTFLAAGNPTSGTQVWLAMDDNNTTDDNHDDMVIRLTIVSGGTFEAVPDGGATLTLLGSALMGLGMLRRKFKA